MLRTLAFIEAHVSFSLSPQYINTKLNVLADNLSRVNLPAFLSDVPQAQRWATPLPTTLIDLLLDLFAGVDLSALAPTVQRYFRNGLTPSTQLTYDLVMNTFCFAGGVVFWTPSQSQRLLRRLHGRGRPISPDREVVPGRSPIPGAAGDQSSLPVLKRV